MDCLEFRQLFDNYAKLDDVELKILENHAENCTECRAELEFFQSIIKTTASIPLPKPPENLIKAVNDRIDNEPRLISTVRGAGDRLRAYSKRYATIAACVAMGLAIGLNSSSIKRHLEDEGEYGVISSTVTSTDLPKESAKPLEQAQQATQAPTEKADTVQAPAVSQAEKSKVKTPSVVTDKPAVKATSKPAQKTWGSTQSHSTSKPAAVKAWTPTQAPAVNTEEAKPHNTQTAVSDEPQTASVPVAVTAEATPEPTSGDGNYVIARSGYVLPEDYDIIAATERNSRSSEPEEDYSLASDDYVIARSSYDLPEDMDVYNLSQTDNLIISSSDIDAVTAIMSEMGIGYSGGSYTTSLDTFYALLNRLTEDGIRHDYSTDYTNGSDFSFKLVMRD